MNIDALKAVRENFKMGYVLSFAEAMLIQQAIDAALQSGNSGQPVTVPDESWRIEAEKQAEIYGQSFVVFRNGEQPQCADPTKVVISFTDKGLGHRSSDAALVIPDGLIAAVNRLLDSDGSRGCYSAIQCYDAREEIERLLAAAPKVAHFRENENSSTKLFREIEETSTKCWCRTCRPVTLSDMRFVVCPDCGNKRCPKANDHRNACTGSNEPGQPGSAYPDAPKGV